MLTAWEKLLQRSLVGSNLDSSQWNSIQAGIRDRAFFSSKVAEINILDALRKACVEYAQGGADLSKLRMQLRDFIARKDIVTKTRLDIILKTNVAQARGFAQFANGMTSGAFAAFPAQEFTRIARRNRQRTDWPERWARAGGKIFDGKMIALKDDPVWTRLSVFGNPFPPFDWGSGMGVMDVDRKTAISLGLITEDGLEEKRAALREREANGDLPSLNGNLQAEIPIRHDSPEAQKLLEAFGDQVKFDGDKLHFRGELIRQVVDGTVKKASLGIGYNGKKTSISSSFFKEHLSKHFGENERRRGNVPLTPGDFELLPWVWRHPDKIARGHSGHDILSLSTIDDCTLHLVYDNMLGPRSFYKTENQPGAS